MEVEFGVLLSVNLQWENMIELEISEKQTNWIKGTELHSVVLPYSAKVITSAMVHVFFFQKFSYWQWCYKYSVHFRNIVILYCVCE